ncbi:hypothetical protein M422DRAFT_775467 [Sphaerobolus stellatus SS14]|nr:hypothetical protein M422DRAFT_775467 [Sphaerobolus stellatus SS14]
MLGVLPTEIILIICSFLPLRQIQRLPQLSRAWQAFVEGNGSEIYRAVALLHDFVPQNITLDDAEELHLWLQNMESWKELCYRFYRLERRWEGYDQPEVSYEPLSLRAPVWRFKLDEEQQTIITTHFDGGLRVRVMDSQASMVPAVHTPTILWEIPHRLVQPYAHCEFTDGFLIFTRRGNTVEVWRRKRDAKADPCPGTLFGDSIQRLAASVAIQTQLSISEDDRGAFVPWTTIRPPNNLRALRATSSKLLLASVDAQEAYLYNLPSGTLKQTVPFLKTTEEPRMEVTYVELSRRHAFICSLIDVHVIPLDPDNDRTALKFPSQIHGFHEFCDNNAYRLEYHDSENRPIYLKPRSEYHSTECVCRKSSKMTEQSPTRSFTAVHVSPCGKHFVTTDEKGFVCIVRNFEEVLRNNGSLLENIIVVDMRHPVMNLAFEDDKRISVFVQGQGVFLIPMTSTDQCSIETYDGESIGCIRLLHLITPAMYNHLRADNTERIIFSSCLQMTYSELWYTWTEMEDRMELEIAEHFLQRVKFALEPESKSSNRQWST